MRFGRSNAPHREGSESARMGLGYCIPFPETLSSGLLGVSNVFLSLSPEQNIRVIEPPTPASRLAQDVT